MRRTHPPAAGISRRGEMRTAFASRLQSGSELPISPLAGEMSAGAGCCTTAPHASGLFLRDIRLAIRAGGGALTGVLFFLAVIATSPSASGRT